MSKKNNSIPTSQPGLFDILDDKLSAIQQELPVHPSIEDFIVETKKITQPEVPPHTNLLEEPVDVDHRPRQAILFRSFGSGSSGNCAFIGDRSGGILIDAGVDGHDHG